MEAEFVLGLYVTAGVSRPASIEGVGVETGPKIRLCVSMMSNLGLARPRPRDDEVG